jgi:hypothetical protein
MKRRQIIRRRALRKAGQCRKQGADRAGQCRCSDRRPLFSIDVGWRLDTTWRSRGAWRPKLCGLRCPLENGGRRESRVPMTPAVVRKNAHGGPQVRRNTRPSLRSGFTAYAVLSPEPNSSGLRRRRIGDRSKARSGPTISISLTPATGARTTRFCRPQLPRAIRLDRPACCRKKFQPRRLSAVRLRAVRSLTGITALQPRARPTLPRPPQPVPTFVTMANAPLLGTG